LVTAKYCIAADKHYPQSLIDLQDQAENKEGI